MGFHTYDVDAADRLEDAADRYRYLSAEELQWALNPNPGDTVLDIGSGTGFYTDDIAPHVGWVVALDIQPGMHAYYRSKGIPKNVAPLTGAADGLPLLANTVDRVVSTMTYHEFASDSALAEISRVLSSEGRVAIVDWSATGSGEAGPSLDERFAPDDVRASLSDAGFGIEFVGDRPETFLVIASSP